MRATPQKDAAPTGIGAGVNDPNGTHDSTPPGLDPPTARERAIRRAHLALRGCPDDDLCARIDAAHDAGRHPRAIVLAGVLDERRRRAAWGVEMLRRRYAGGGA